MREREREMLYPPSDVTEDKMARSEKACIDLAYYWKIPQRLIGHFEEFIVRS